MDVSSQKPFIVSLIEKLIREEFISEAIKIPLLIGAYDVYLQPKIIDIHFLEHVYMDVVKSLYKGNCKVYFRECSASGDFAISLCDNKPKETNLTITHNGVNVIYCKDDSFGNNVSTLSSLNAKHYFFNKFLQIAIKYCNFSDLGQYPHMKELCTSKYLPSSKDEFEIIKSIIGV